MSKTTTPAGTPDWVKLGTEVMLHGGAGDALIRTKIDKLNPKSFRVAGSAVLFPYVSVRGELALSQRIGGTWGSTLQVVPLDSEKGQQLLRGMRVRRARRVADNAFHNWVKTRTVDDLQALRAALTNSYLET